MEETKATYKDFDIRIVPQEKRGDYTEVFFRIFRNDESDKTFILWIRTSGTNSKNLSKDQIFEYLKTEGLKQVKNMIDREEYEKDKEYKISI